MCQSFNMPYPLPALRRGSLDYATLSANGPTAPIKKNTTGTRLDS